MLRVVTTSRYTTCLSRKASFNNIVSAKFPSVEIHLFPFHIIPIIKHIEERFVYFWYDHHHRSFLNRYSETAVS